MYCRSAKASGTGVRQSSRIPAYLYVLLVLYCSPSLLHFDHSAEFQADYPILPAWLTRLKVYLAWLVVTAVGAAGAILLTVGLRLFGRVLIAGYAPLGFAGLDRY